MIEAMKRALKTFEKIHEGCGFVKEDDLHKDAKDLATYVQEDCDFTIKTLRQAIEQAEKQEPVAKVVLTDNIGLPLLRWVDLDRQFIFKGGEFLYTAPPKREWVGLTEEEGVDIYNTHHNTYGECVTSVYDLVLDIEAKLKEKNEFHI